jgi:hypothetical protein
MPPRAEVVLMSVALQNAAEVAQEVVKVAIALFGLDVEISVPTIFPGCSFDAIGLKFGGEVVRMVQYLVAFPDIVLSRKSAAPRIWKLSPLIMGKMTSRVMMTLLPSQMR